MKIGILTIGNELTSGKTQDTNSSFIARQANVQGWHVSVLMSVGDDEDAIRTGLEYTMSLSDCVIITGGLGPTVDDITTQAVANAFSLPLYSDASSLKNIKDRFSMLGLTWTENNAKQALFPEGAETILNPLGTARGFFLKKNGKGIVVMPGVPSETRRMLPEEVIPIVRREFSEDTVHVENRLIKIFGISEARIDDILSDIDFNELGVGIGFYPNFPEIHVFLTARCAAQKEAKKKIKQAEEKIVHRLRPYIFAYDEEKLEEIVAALLTSKKLSLSVAESCTGGLVADRLTDIPGSSVYFERGVIVYSNRSKTDILGVPEGVIDNFGAVSEQVAVLMAEGIRNISNADLGLATTGIAGPSGGTEEKPVGTLYVALTDGQEVFCRRYTFSWDRRRHKILSSQAALLMLRKYLIGELNAE